MADVVQMTLDTGMDHLYQWDLNRKLIVPSTLTEVRFVQPGKSTALRVAVVDGTADVPNILLQASGMLTAFAFITDHTVYAQTWQIDPMNKPDDYVYTATEILSWTTINDEAQAAINLANSLIASTETARTQTLDAKVASESARDDTIAAKEVSQQSASDALASKNAAALSAQNAAAIAANMELDAEKRAIMMTIVLGG